MHTINNSFLSCCLFSTLWVFVCVSSPFIPFTSCWGLFFLWYFMTILWCVLVFYSISSFRFFVHGIFIQVLEKLCFVVNLRMCHNFCLLRCFIAAAHILYISTCMVRHQQLNNFPLFKHSLPEVCVSSLSLFSFRSMHIHHSLLVYVSYHIMDWCRCTLHHTKKRKNYTQYLR